MNKSIINKLKENNQDFEWYPTTKKMIEIIFNDYTKDKKEYNGMIRNFSMLDIGAGNGNIFNIFESLLPIPKDNYSKTYIKKFAIEKSEILINEMVSDIIIIGTDFLEQTLIDKKVDMIFCNPPYKQFETWMIKIIKESNCNTLYFVVPDRWKDNKEIMDIINKRCPISKYDDENKKQYEIIYSDTFINSEYRESRANIDIIKISFDQGYKSIEPFDIWFEDNFKISAEKNDSSLYSYEKEKEKQKRESIKSSLIKGQNIIERLEELYKQDLEKLLSNYKQLEKLDYEIFKELNINIDNLKKGLKQKIEGLKNLYWKELFNNLNKITERLTSKSRKQILNKLNNQTNIDFTKNNAYALIIWVLKNANIYIDEQLKDIYFEMASKDNIINYKSNTHFIKDTWRYAVKDHTHFKLDYRLVFERWNCFNPTNYGKNEFPKGLANRVHEFINDICTVGNNLGFSNINSSYDFDWNPGKNIIFYYDGNKTFMEIKAYKKGTIHCKFNIEFIKKLNIEMARLNKWVKNETELSTELNIPIEEVKKYLNSNKKLIQNDIKYIGVNL